MNTTTRVAPIVIAGFGGMLLGWMLAPNMDAVREDVQARFAEQTPVLESLRSSVAELGGRIEQLPDAQAVNATVQGQLAAFEQRFSQQTDAITQALSQAPQAVSDTLDQLRQQMETLSSELTDLRGEVAENEQARMRADEARQASGNGDAANLAEAVGPRGAVLLPGQGAIFAGTRVDLSSLDAGNNIAVMTAQDGAAERVSVGDQLQLSDSCSVDLVGIAAGAAYLRPENCTPQGAEGQQAGGENGSQANGVPGPVDAAAGGSLAPAPAASAPGGQMPGSAETPNGATSPLNDGPMEPAAPAAR